MPAVESTTRSAWLPTLLTIGLLILLLNLGFWQLDRAYQKALMQQQFQEGLSLAPTALSELNLHDTAVRFRQVVTTGIYDPDRQILLDNQIVDGQVGVHVYTPLRLSHSPDQAVLVNRGWMPMAPGHEVSLPLPVSSEEQEINGRLSQPANPGLRLGDAVPADWPGRLSYIDYQALNEVLPYELLPAVVLLSPEADQGFERLWRPTFGGIGPERHRGYAVQWFALAVTLLLLYSILTVNAWRQRQS